MDKLSLIALPIAVIGSAAALVAILGPEAEGAADPHSAATPDRMAALEQQLDDLTRDYEELHALLDTTRDRLAALELQPAAASRQPLASASDPELPDGAATVLTALAEGGPAPASLDAWIDQAMEARQQEQRERRRNDFQQTFEGLLTERIDDLAELLDLEPYQTDQVETLFSDQIAAASEVMASSDSPIEIMRSLAPLREDRDTQLQEILTPEQYSSFLEQEGGFGGPPRGLFGAGPR